MTSKHTTGDMKKQVDYLIKITPQRVVRNKRRDIKKERELQSRIPELLSEYESFNVSMVLFYRTKILTKHIEADQCAFYFPTKNTNYLLIENIIINRKS